MRQVVVHPMESLTQARRERSILLGGRTDGRVSQAAPYRGLYAKVFPVWMSDQ